MTKNEIVGQQIPLTIQKRKDKIAEMLKTAGDLRLEVILPFFNSLNESTGDYFGKILDRGLYQEAAQVIREHFLRKVIQKKLSEIVRKKADGGYVIYRPRDPNNPDSKPEKAGEVGNPALAYDKLAQLTHDKSEKEKISKRATYYRKHPEKASRQKPVLASKKKPKKENLQHVVENLVQERLFREESVGSAWDDYLANLPAKSLEGDKKFQNLQSKIEKVTEAVLQDSLNAIKKAVGKIAKIEDHGIKKNEEMGQSYLSFSALLGNVLIEPIFIYADKGIPKLEMSPEAEACLGKAEMDAADLFRGRLASVQEKVMAKVKNLHDAIAARDRYLEKLEVELDKHLQGLSPLQINLLKFTLMKSYRRS